jgi:hypothetical protein
LNEFLVRGRTRAGTRAAPPVEAEVYNMCRGAIVTLLVR